MNDQAEGGQGSQESQYGQLFGDESAQQGHRPQHQSQQIERLHRLGLIVMVMLQQPVVEMFAVRGHDANAGIIPIEKFFGKPPPDRQSDIEHRYATGQQRHQQGWDGGHFRAGQDSQAAHHIAQEHTAGITQEDAGRMQVVAQEAKAGTS